MPHCTQGAYSPLGGSHRICSLITAAVTQHTGLIPDRQISVTATLSLTSLLQASFCQRRCRPMSLRGNVAWIKIPQSAVLHDMTEPPSLTESRGEMVVGLLAWIHESAIVARKHCQVRWNFKGYSSKIGSSQWAEMTKIKTSLSTGNNKACWEEFS